MAIVATYDSAFNGNTNLESMLARGGNVAFGRVQGTYGGAWSTLTVGGMNNVSFVVFDQNAWNLQFQYRVASTVLAIMIPGSLTSTIAGFGNMVTCPTSFDLACVTCIFNGTVTAGVAFCAFGF
jgi:hypothetical protein